MSVISHWQVPTIFIAPGVTWYRKFEIRVKGKGSWWIFDSFLVSRNRVGQGRETLLFSCLLLTHLTNSGKSRNPEVFLPCFVDFSPCPCRPLNQIWVHPELSLCFLCISLIAYQAILIFEYLSEVQIGPHLLIEILYFMHNVLLKAQSFYFFNVSLLLSPYLPPFPSPPDSSWKAQNLFSKW